MNYLVDANLSPSIAEQLRADGRDAVHVFDIGLATASDEVIYDHAERNGYTIITADTDFPTLVALRRATSPSVVLLRGVAELAPDYHAALLIANLDTVEGDLKRGAIVSLSPQHLRIRNLPIR